MQTDLITKVYFNEHLTHSCVGMPQGLQALLSSSYFMCIFIYKYINSQLPNNIFDAFFTLTTSIHDYKTRHHSNLRPALHNTKASSFCIRVQGPKIWNSIPQDIKDCKLLNPFKYKLKNYLLATYQKIK